MRWPWSRREKRDSGGDFSDAVIRLIESQAAGTAADASSTAAVEAASGALSRAFASAEVVAAPWVQEAISPATLAQIGRDLVRRGDSMHVIRIDGAGTVGLVPASSWHCVNGGAKLVHPGGAKLVHLTLCGTRCWGVVPVVHRRDPRCFVSRLRYAERSSVGGSCGPTGSTIAPAVKQVFLGISAVFGFG